MTFDTAATLLDWFGVVVFAVSGVLVASRKQSDVVGASVKRGANSRLRLRAVSD